MLATHGDLEVGLTSEGDLLHLIVGPGESRRATSREPPGRPGVQAPKSHPAVAGRGGDPLEVPMARSLFDSSLVGPARARGRGAALVSFCAHASGIAALVAAPFLSDAELPPAPAAPPPPVPRVVLPAGGGGSTTVTRPPSPRVVVPRVTQPSIPVPSSVEPLTPADGLLEDVPACPDCLLGGAGDPGGGIPGDGAGFGPGPIGPGFEPAAAVEPVRVSSLTGPRRLRFVEPEYHEAARRARIEGIVILECVVDARGRVSDVRVLRGIPVLDAAAVAAVRDWAYAPTLLSGVPVPVVMTVTVRFDLP